MSAQNAEITFGSIGQTKLNSHKRINFEIRSVNSGFNINLEFFVLQSITSNLPSENMDADNWNIPKNITLAYPEFYTSSKIDMLIGAEIYTQLMSIGQIKINGLPTIQITLLGWIILGRVPQYIVSLKICATVINSMIEDTMDEKIKKIWDFYEGRKRSRKVF